ncbi:MAG: hypothetical protein UT58_C0011G0002 [Microgenomates group bacterium GW2011_GWC1_39_7b]|uniref:Glycosyltransferase RgtA/B/C/D-like domain-containing protein n=3 Tax=Candidatus Woeseibacteriota TaxID=1752722 RepID=A0A0G0P217_9BACT|nr:MAG: hypothetical protein UT17_C0003G0147 [Candidatus Woesebacteria bacterium GW2011_GWB1_39_10]KKR26503.1 MAG: hypothetical protein UT58_C0011G0002 [Microgenomates group bacterium GW2011_GWC1_39_7b]KKR74311.1 MAG: hypothetical protein UU16_C0002G0002 [Candidatus Woesebacteria bacterium GW2011_GWA2_40_7]KKS91084.1 MAG: hypothetical protein UV66_C0001G0441 [Candidatus Woesebacteria bacterium GW2011_GWA1_43_12]
MRDLFKKIRKEPVWILVLALSFFIYAIFNSHIIKQDLNGNLTTGESTYGDLPFHLATISRMAYTGTFPPENPLFSDIPLVYPFFINVLSAAMVIWGFGLRASIILPGMFFSILMIVSLYFFYKKLTGLKSVAFLGTLLFFLNGGLGFYYFFKDVVFNGKLQNFITGPGAFPDYSHLFGQNIQWCNFLSRILIPERSVLLGIPMGIAILYILFLKEKKDEKNLNWWYIFAAVLTGFLPLSHTHTFIVFSLLIPFLAVFELRKNNWVEWLKKWSIFGTIVLLIAAPQLKLIFFHLNTSSSFFRFHLGWMSDPGILEFIIFWWKNTGILIPSLILSIFFIKPYKLLTRLILFSSFIFVIINLFIFQPFDWDNIKFLFWFAIFAYAAVAFLLVKLWQSKIFFGKILTGILIASLTLSSLLSIYREINVSYQLFSKEEVDLGLWVRKNTQFDSLFLTEFTHRSFASNLGGRKILMGYQGSLWVHGIKYGDRERDIKVIYSGTANAKSLLYKYDVNYVVIGPGERDVLKANERFFIENFCLVKATTNYRIYSVKCDSK